MPRQVVAFVPVSYRRSWRGKEHINWADYTSRVQSWLNKGYKLFSVNELGTTVFIEQQDWAKDG